MKFLCDQMLVRLGRWLRAAGYDTLIIQTNMSDNDILNLGGREHRIIITRDRLFPKAPNVIILYSNLLEDCVQELKEWLKIHWLYHPFSRCLICNTILMDAPPHLLNKVPPDLLKTSSQFWYCPSCDKIYWTGSHVSRMLKKLSNWENS